MERKKFSTLGDALERYLGDSPLADGMRYARVCEAWDTAVGDAIAHVTLAKEFEAGVLRVRMSSSVVRMQLEMNKPEILARINEALGDNLVKSIIIR
ncbi:MAG: DUF721 domain-containing protein [Bacteroidales bacterium]|nr:DUF721 domain-containing protein [Bacteroidales bacterium]